jgi:hypothetical protein
LASRGTLSPNVTAGRYSADTDTHNISIIINNHDNGDVTTNDDDGKDLQPLLKILCCKLMVSFLQEDNYVHHMIETRRSSREKEIRNLKK